MVCMLFFFSSRRRHTRFALGTGVQTCALPIYLSIAYVRIGLTPDGGATAFLGAALPRQLVAEMVFTGDRVPVERLHALGLANRLVAPGKAVETALEQIRRATCRERACQYA